MINNIMLKKLILVILVVMIVFAIIPIKTNASALSDVISGADSFLSKGKKSTKSTMDSSEVKSASDIIYNMLLGVGMLLVLAVGSILGIKFMLSSAEDKADIKQALIPYVVGSIVIFGAFGIWKIVITIGSNL